MDKAVPPVEDEIDQRILLTFGWELWNYARQFFRELRKLDYITPDRNQTFLPTKRDQVPKGLL